MRPDLEQIAVTVLSCPGVAGLHGGYLDGISTLLPQGRLRGLNWDGTTLLIGVVGRYPASVPEIATQVRSAVAALAPGLPVIVSVEDLHFPDPSTSSTRPSAPRSIPEVAAQDTNTPPIGTPPVVGPRGRGRHRAPGPTPDPATQDRAGTDAPAGPGDAADDPERP